MLTYCHPYEKSLGTIFFICSSLNLNVRPSIHNRNLFQCIKNLPLAAHSSFQKYQEICFLRVVSSSSNQPCPVSPTDGLCSATRWPWRPSSCTRRPTTRTLPSSGQCSAKTAPNAGHKQVRSLVHLLFIELRISLSHALISCCIMKASSWTYLMYILKTKTLRAPEFKLTTFQPNHFLS